jgi:outer membrane protein assembly factor BamD (BamD/ComL family)
LIAVCLVVAPMVSAFGIPDEKVKTSDPVKTALEHLQKGRYEEAIDAYTDLAKDKEYAAQAKLGQARAHLAVGQFEKAEESCGAAL